MNTPNTPTAPRADPAALAIVADYKEALARGEHRVLQLSGADLRDSDMSGIMLDECDLTGATLDGARFTGASLVRSSLAGAKLLGADFSYSNLDRADLEAADATAASFVNAKLVRAIMSRCQLLRANLSDADLTKANLFESNLNGANLSHALASQANLNGASLEDTVLTGLRGEPLFTSGAEHDASGMQFGWPAARLDAPQLTGLAELYLRAQGWGIVEPSNQLGETIDLMARHNDTWIMLQVKATATPSLLTFSRLAENLKNLAHQSENVFLLIVMPGPIPETLRKLAETYNIGLLSVRLEHNSMRVEEVARPANKPLAASA